MRVAYGKTKTVRYTNTRQVRAPPSDSSTPNFDNRQHISSPRSFIYLDHFDCFHPSDVSTRFPNDSIGRSKWILDRHSQLGASFQTAVQQLGVDTTTAACMLEWRTNFCGFFSTHLLGFMPRLVCGEYRSGENRRLVRLHSVRITNRPV